MLKLRLNVRPSDITCNKSDFLKAQKIVLNGENSQNLEVSPSIIRIIKGIKFLCKYLSVSIEGKDLLKNIYNSLKKIDDFGCQGLAHRVNQILGFDDLGDLNILNEMLTNFILIQKINLNGEITHIYNNKGKLINGYEKEELLGQNVSILKSGFQDKDFYKELWSILLSGKIWKGIMYNKKKDGKIHCIKKIIYPIKDINGNIIEFIELSVDITEEDKNINTDSLLNITNRNRFDKLLEYELKNRNKFSLLFLDIDYFKKVNDTYGHLSGDLVLKEIANTIKNKIKFRDVFARYGGEEFIIMLPGTDIKGGVTFSERIRKLIEGLIIVDKQGNQIKVTISIGVVEKANDDDVDSILKRADEALYNAKNGGRNQVVSFDKEGNIKF